MSELKDRAETELKAVTTPLYNLVGELDAAIIEGERELSELRELRRNAKQVLRTLDPPPKQPKPSNEKLATATRERHARERQEKKNRLIHHLHTEAWDGGRDITADGLLKDPAGPNSNGDPTIGKQLMTDLLVELRDEGILRLDRKAFGGQPVYRRVGRV